MNPIVLSIFLGLSAAAANVFGGTLIVQRNWERNYLRYFVALGAGFMLATAFVEMVPESLELAGRKGALLVLAGIFFVTGGVSAASYWLLETFPLLGQLG